MPTILPSLTHAIRDAAKALHNTGRKVEAEKWQGTKAPHPMHETLFYSFSAIMPGQQRELVTECKPNLPWADEHFAERVSGIAYNPPPSHKIWPFAQQGNKEHGGDSKFSHTYPERMWPPELKGIRYNYGQLSDVVKQLIREPATRQAFLPIWFPEDTGAIVGQRVPCTLGYHFLLRQGFLHCIYHIRSCDYIRHFRDDVYLAARLVTWMIDECADKTFKNGPFWSYVKPGILTMHIGSLHCFLPEVNLLVHHYAT